MLCLKIFLEIEDVLIRELQKNQDLNGSIRFATIHGGYQLPEKGSLIGALRDVYSSHSLTWDPQVFRSHSDANILWAAGTKSIILGPGRLEKAHVPDEAVSFDQVQQAAQIYLDLLTLLCGHEQSVPGC
jgi:acetylornithine deacetylase